MKNFTIACSVFLFCCSLAYGQTIRRVNNTGIPLGTNMYATLQEAHNAASNGDIIYIEGSGTNYAGATLTKKLTIIGPGYFLGENYAHFPDLRAVSFNNSIITFNTGSAGSQLIGCSDFTARINVSDIIITRNTASTVQLGSSISASLSNISITKNYETYISGFSTQYGINVLIANNHLDGTSSLNNSNYSGVFTNNLITGNFSLNNFTVSNNILTNGSSVNFTNCNFLNNIDARALTNSSAFGTTNGNQANIDRTTLFVGVTGTSTDGQWKLKTGSPALGAGFNGIDCGIYGGLDPYVLSGIVSSEYPTITSLTTTGAGSNTTPLKVTISTKSN